MFDLLDRVETASIVRYLSADCAYDVRLVGKEMGRLGLVPNEEKVVQREMQRTCYLRMPLGRSNSHTTASCLSLLSALCKFTASLCSLNVVDHLYQGTRTAS